jgi:hypothetical protein
MMRWTPLAEGLAASRASLDARQAAAVTAPPVPLLVLAGSSEAPY